MVFELSSEQVAVLEEYWFTSSESYRKANPTLELVLADKLEDLFKLMRTQVYTRSLSHLKKHLAVIRGKNSWRRRIVEFGKELDILDKDIAQITGLTLSEIKGIAAVNPDGTEVPVIVSEDGGVL